MTTQEIITAVRLLLNDSDSSRYTDAQLIRAVNDAQTRFFNDTSLENSLKLKSLTTGQSVVEVASSTLTASELETSVRDIINDKDKDVIPFIDVAQKKIFDDLALGNGLKLLTIEANKSTYEI